MTSMSDSQTSKPTIIGLYGISGTGKSFLVKQLKQDAGLKEQGFVFYDGSELIDMITPGGLEAFQAMEPEHKTGRIEAALTKVTTECQEHNSAAVIAGHHMFWNPSQVPKHATASVEKDWQTYSHIIYLDVAVELVAQRIAQDKTRTRTVSAVRHLAEWQARERDGLRNMCRERGVLFTTIGEAVGAAPDGALERVKGMLRDFKGHEEAVNDRVVYAELDAEMQSHGAAWDKLLATPTRDASLRGHPLREAHEAIGHYLAMAHLSSMLGTEETAITHVQGQRTDGYRFRQESSTIIIPLMRGGEPMAFGVSRALQTASFVHANKYRDIGRDRFIGKRAVILVDSVINKGTSVDEFVGDLRQEHPAPRVVVVTGVVQANAVEAGKLADRLAKDRNLSIVALRKSENSYTGRKGTDTGYRMFNTTNLE